MPAQLYTHHEHEHGEHEHGMLSNPTQVRSRTAGVVQYYHQCLKTNLKTHLQMLGGDVLARSLI